MCSCGTLEYQVNLHSRISSESCYVLGCWFSDLFCNYTGNKQYLTVYFKLAGSGNTKLFFLFK